MKNFSAAVVNHQCISEVIDVLRSAGEVNEFLVLAQFSILIKLLLQKVLYRFDVVICSRLDGFDALCIF